MTKESSCCYEKESEQPAETQPYGQTEINPWGQMSTNVMRSRKSIAPRLQTRSIIQAKLTFGQPNDQYEREADAVAAEVMEQFHSTQAALQDRSGIVPQDTMPQKHEQSKEKLLQQEEMTVESKHLRRPSVLSERLTSSFLQKKSVLQSSDGIRGEAVKDFEKRLSATTKSADRQPLEPKLQRSMEQIMVTDFSGVKIHKGTDADQLARDMQARAFTVGQDIFFRQGEYQSSSLRGKKLLAHELTHVRQQRKESAISRLTSLSSNLLSKQVETAAEKQSLSRDTGNMHIQCMNADPNGGEDKIPGEYEDNDMDVDDDDIDMSEGDEEKEDSDLNEEENKEKITDTGTEKLQRGNVVFLIETEGNQYIRREGITAYTRSKKKTIKREAMIEKAIGGRGKKRKYNVSFNQIDSNGNEEEVIVSGLAREQLFHQENKEQSTKRRRMIRGGTKKESREPDYNTSKSWFHLIVNTEKDEDYTEPEKKKEDDDKHEIEVDDADQQRDEDEADQDSEEESKLSARDETFKDEETVSPLISLFRNFPGYFTKLQKYSQSIAINDLPASSNTKITDAAIKRGDIVTKDTFSVFFVSRDKKISVILKHTDKEKKAQYRHPSELKESEEEYMAKNRKFPKTTKKQKELATKEGIDAEKKKSRLKGGTKHDYHAEEITVDTAGVQAAISEAIEDAKRIFEEYTRKEINELSINELSQKEYESLLEIKREFILGINRTSCAHCTNYLIKFCNQFWKALAQATSQEYAMMLKKERIFHFIQSAASFYSETKEAHLKALIKECWQITAHPLYNSRKMAPEVTEKTSSLVARLIKIYEELSIKRPETTKGPKEVDEENKGAITVLTPGKIVRKQRVITVPTPEDLFRKLGTGFKETIIKIKKYYSDKEWESGLNELDTYVTKRLKEIWQEVTGGEEERNKSNEVKKAGPQLKKLAEDLQMKLKEMLANREKKAIKTPEEKKSEPPDIKKGNCLFEAVLSAMKKTVSAENVMGLRALLAKAIQDDPLTYINFIPGDVENVITAVNDAANFLAGDGNWDNNSGDIAPIALANALGYHIIIIQQPDDKVLTAVGPPAADPIVIYYNGRNHYWA